MAEKPSEEKERGFVVVDRRHGRQESEPPESPPAEEREPAKAVGTAEAEGASSRAGPLPAVDFPTFLLSLSTSALYHMGLVEGREGEEPPEPNLPMARHTIDILEMLETKTQGNLEPEEQRLLGNLLYELHMRFVEVSK